MTESLRAAIFDVLHDYPQGFPVSGEQLAAKLKISPEVIQATATEMGEFPPQYDELVIVTTATLPPNGTPDGFYVQLSPWDAQPAES